MDISIVIPLYNEQESLSPLIKAITQALSHTGQSYEVIFVDDGSTDDSFNEIKKLHNTYGSIVKAYRFSRNYGKSAALSAGIQFARGEYIITMDGDLQDDPEAIPDMITKLESGWDLVSGWKKVRHDPISKTMPSKVWNSMTSLVSGIKLHDFNCGFKAYKSDAAKSLRIYGERHRYLPALAFWDGYAVTEIPVPHHPRKFGKSKFGAGRMFNGLMDMITLLFLRRYLTKPLHFFGLIGLLFMLAGLSVIGYFGIEWIITQQMRIRPLMILSLGSMIMGIQIFSIGLVGEMITHSQETGNGFSIRERLGEEVQNS